MKLELNSSKTIALFSDAFQVASDATQSMQDGSSVFKKVPTTILDTIKICDELGFGFMAKIEESNSNYDYFTFYLIIKSEDTENYWYGVKLVVNNIEAEKLFKKHNIKFEL